ncbi:hypothetical protein FACS1894163_08940 [Spirochaetia bacterium]|nr:hypothetical protein FACS1894163_08940 [Spirochaetia bacterium]
MLKDSQLNNQLPKYNDLTIEPDFEIDKIFEFIENNITNFPGDYSNIRESNKESYITDLLIQFFERCKIKQSNGFSVYGFRKAQARKESRRESDISVVSLESIMPIPIVEFEAKRLSDFSNNKEYVCGDTGGIERFKRGYYSHNHKKCGMFGYILSRDSDYWMKKINYWIEELATTNYDPFIDWTNNEEKLKKTLSLSKVEKYSSNNTRKETNDNILIWHYFIDLK